MEQDNFDKLIAKIHQSKSDVEKQLAATVIDLEVRSHIHANENIK